MVRKHRARLKQEINGFWERTADFQLEATNGTKRKTRARPERPRPGQATSSWARLLLCTQQGPDRGSDPKGIRNACKPHYIHSICPCCGAKLHSAHQDPRLAGQNRRRMGTGGDMLPTARRVTGVLWSFALDKYWRACANGPQSAGPCKLQVVTVYTVIGCPYRGGYGGGHLVCMGSSYKFDGCGH
jgi:hypothetical protein